MNAEVKIRDAEPADGAALMRLAALDSAPAPTGRVILAEVEEELRAALPLDGGPPIADPFRRTAELVALLELRAAQLRRGDGGHASGEPVPPRGLRALAPSAGRA